MRTMIMLRATLALAATGMAGQIATGIHLQEVHFTGDTRLDGVHLKKCARASTQQLPDTNYTHQFVITFDIDAGPRYRLGRITFKDNHAISDTKAMRDLFPIKDGDILDRKAIAKGLENLRYA